jgi:hypothetical protein
MLSVLNRMNGLSPSLVDEESKLLLVSTEVLGRAPGDSVQVKGFVPLDRLQFEEVMS